MNFSINSVATFLLCLFIQSHLFTLLSKKSIKQLKCKLLIHHSRIFQSPTDALRPIPFAHVVSHCATHFDIVLEMSPNCGTCLGKYLALFRISFHSHFRTAHMLTSPHLQLQVIVVDFEANMNKNQRFEFCHFLQNQPKPTKINHHYVWCTHVDFQSQTQ